MESLISRLVAERFLLHFEHLLIKYNIKFQPYFMPDNLTYTLFVTTQ